jgi:hypothetical protein
MTYRKPPSRGTGPWLRSGKIKPEWVRPTGNTPPSVGGSLATLRGALGDRREQAYLDYVHRISTAWQKKGRT